MERTLIQKQIYVSSVQKEPTAMKKTQNPVVPAQMDGPPMG